MALTEDEAAVYDRQIRLWGVEAQKRLRSSRMLLVGLDGLAAEVCKNIVLAGIKSLTLLDNQDVCQDDLRSQFLLPSNSIGQNRAEASLQRAKELNPLVHIITCNEDINKMSDDYFRQFDLVCVCECPKSTMVRIGSICHELKIQFYCGCVYGFYGYFFVDLLNHNYTEEIQRSKWIENTEGSKNWQTEFVVKQSATRYVDINEAFEISHRSFSAKRLNRVSHVFFLMKVIEKFRHKMGRKPTESNEDIESLQMIRNDLLEEDSEKLLPSSYLQNCVSKFYPICAIVGGVLGQDIVKALSAKELPINNFFFFDGSKSEGVIDRILTA